MPPWPLWPATSSAMVARRSHGWSRRSGVHLQRATAAAASGSVRSAEAVGLLAGEVQAADLSLQGLGRVVTIAMLVDQCRLIVGGR